MDNMMRGDIGGIVLALLYISLLKPITNLVTIRSKPKR